MRFNELYLANHEWQPSTNINISVITYRNVNHHKDLAGYVNMKYGDYEVLEFGIDWATLTI